MHTEQEITAAYVGIGNELLSGSVQDANFHYLAQALWGLGIRLMRAVVIPDEQEIIRETLDLFRGRFDHIFTSGGLGPTHDDVTVEGVALALGVPELFRQKFEGIKEHFRTRPYYTEEVISRRRESAIADLLSETLDRFPSIKIGSYPQWGESGYRVKIVVESKERESVTSAAAHLRKALG